MAKYNIYAVAYGIDPKTSSPVFNLKFKTWDECKPYVVGVTDAKYKGFLTDKEANAWLSQVVTLTVTPDSNPSGIAASKLDTSLYQVSHYDEEFKSICIKLGVFPNELSLYLQRQFVDEHKFISQKANKPDSLPFKV